MLPSLILSREVCLCHGWFFFLILFRIWLVYHESSSSSLSSVNIIINCVDVVFQEFFFFIQNTIIITIIMTTTEEEMNIWKTKKNSVPFILLFYSIILWFSFSNRMIFQEFLFVYCFFSVVFSWFLFFSLSLSLATSFGIGQIDIFILIIHSIDWLFVVP